MGQENIHQKRNKLQQFEHKGEAFFLLKLKKCFNGGEI